MPFPFVPNGFTEPLPVETGLAPNTVLGRLDAAAAITEFYYTKVISRTIDPNNIQSIRNSWTIQIVENNDPGARVLFDQTVDMGITTFAGGAFTGWFFVLDHGQSVGQFKTRIVNATPVTQVPETFAGQNPAGGAGVPSYPYLSNLKETTITVTLPPLPDGASKLVLWASHDNNSVAVKVGEGQPGTVFTVSDSIVGQSAPENIWFFVEAVQANGSQSKFSPKVRDAFVMLDGTTQIGGYEGWKNIGGAITHPTVFSESSVDTDANDSFQVFGGKIDASWESPVYKCSLPPNAIVKIVHDGWASASVIQDKFTFALGFKYGNDAMLFAPSTQETWALYRGNAKPGTSALQCARTKKVTGFNLLPDSDAALRFPDNSSGVDRTWMFQNRTWLFVFAQQGQKLVGCYSKTKGQTWEVGVNILDGVQIMGMTNNDDSSIVWAFGNQNGTPARVVLKLTRQVPSENTGDGAQTVSTEMLWRVTTLEPIPTTGMAVVPPWFETPVSITRPHGQTGLAYVWFKSGSKIQCFKTTEYFRVWEEIALGNG